MTNGMLPAFSKFNRDPCIDLAQFRAFIATFPPRKHYDYGDSCKCPLGQFLQSIGEPAYARSGTALPEMLQNALNPDQNDQNHVLTYGALLKRLEAIA